MKLRLALLAFLLLGALLPYDGVADVHPTGADQGMNLLHWFGTDHLGRDVFRRTLAGARSFFVPGAVAMAVAGACGTGIGAAAGWFGGAAAASLRAVTGAIAAIPSLALVLLILLIYGAGPAQLGLAVGVASAPAVAESVFLRVDSLRRAEFVLAARGHGIPDGRLFWWHLLWVNGRHVIVRELLGTLGAVLVAEVTLAYLGEFAGPVEQASWGSMIAHALNTGCTNHLALLAPGAAVLTTLWATQEASWRS